ncbi:MAG TPA: universal stress protein [Methylomirabilota bacterium]|nr:universal stress protein [Methylomirabilota bacterium]
MAVIVVGVDFTPYSRSALRQALRIAASRGAVVQAVHVIETLVVVDLEEALGAFQAGIREGLVRDAGKAWREFTADIPEASALDLAVEIDHPVSAMVRQVRERSAELLVLGTHGTVPAERGAGTLATACVRKAPGDVLLVRDPQVGPFRSVVACIDFSPVSLRALEQAVRMARQDHAVLHVLHVLDAPWTRLHYRAPTPQASPDYQKQYRDSLRRRLEAFCEVHQREMAELESRYSLLEFVGPSAGIVEFVQQVGGDLVVLGTQGRSGLRDMLLGSTAERVLREALCSILAVKPHGP